MPGEEYNRSKDVVNDSVDQNRRREKVLNVLKNLKYQIAKEIVYTSRREGKNDEEIVAKLKKFKLDQNILKELLAISKQEKKEVFEQKQPDQIQKKQEEEQRQKLDELRLKQKEQQEKLKLEEEQPKTAQEAKAKEPPQKQEPTEEQTKDEKKEEKKGFDRDKDIFTPEEFEKLENKENKSVFGTLFNKNKGKEDDNDKDKEEKIDLLSQREVSKKIKKLQKQVEEDSIFASKLSGKIEMLIQKGDETSERIQAINEKIGELRSTVLGRERVFNKMEEDFNNVKFIVNTFSPKNMEKRFEDINKEMITKDAIIGKVENKLQILEDKLNEYLNTMSRIKSFENVVKELERIKGVEERIKKMSGETDKAASKVEIISQNIRESLKKINESFNTANSNKDTIKELLVSLTKIESKLDFLAKKEELEFLKDDVGTIKKAIFDKSFNLG